MRRAVPIVFVVALVAASAGGGARAQSGSQASIVVFHSSVDVDARTTALERAHGFTSEFRYRHALRGFAARLDPQQLAAVEADPAVAFVSADRPVQAVDALAPGESTPTGTLRVAATTSTTAQPAAGVNVAVIDTGIDLNYASELNAVAGRNCINGSNPPQDDNGHGTHVSGTIAARNTGTGVVGVAPGTRLYAVKVLDASGSGTNAQVICGIDWVTQNAAALGIRVASMSLGGSGSNDNNCGNSNGDAMHLAICNSVAAGVSYVVAAGNSGANFATSTPAAYPEVVTVTAVSDSDGKPGGTGGSPTCRTGEVDDRYASFSSFAGSSDTVAKAHTIAAPGVCINSTWLGGGYNMISGTSMATPHVSGAVALCISRGACTAGASPSSIISAIQTTDPSNGFAGDPNAPVSGRYYGYLLWVGSTSPPPSGTLTFTVSASGDDGDVMANNMGVSGATYPPSPATASSTGWQTFGVRKAGPFGGGYELRVGLARFDTSALPNNATITAAKLRLYVTSRQSADNRKLVAEWYPATNWPIDAADYTTTPATTASAGLAVTTLTTGAQNDLTLQNLGSISLTGLTALRLHLDGGQPTGENAVWVASYDDGTLPRAQLVVDYTTP